MRTLPPALVHQSHPDRSATMDHRQLAGRRPLPLPRLRRRGALAHSRPDVATFSLTTASEESLDKEQMMPIRANQATMWTLSVDRKTVRLAVPPLRIVGFPKPLDVFMDFDAQSVDAMIERLTVLRSQMLPPLPAPGKRN
jgi:hypothetical protein